MYIHVLVVSEFKLLNLENNINMRPDQQRNQIMESVFKRIFFSLTKTHMHYAHIYLENSIKNRKTMYMLIYKKNNVYFIFEQLLQVAFYGKIMCINHLEKVAIKRFFLFKKMNILCICVCARTHTHVQMFLANSVYLNAPMRIQE